jgi:alkylation response protein AidB-like acyl-CoA dehydrogenase
VRDYAAERHYRDARVNRIFEGTNEINRLLIPGMLVRRALKGGLPLIPAARKLQDDLLSPSVPEPAGQAPLEAELRLIAGMKKAALMILGTAMQTFGEALTDQQEVLSTIADVVIDVFAAESAALRAAAMPDGVGRAAATVLVHDASARVEAATRTALAGTAEGDSLRTLLAALRRVLKVAPVNTVALRRQIADAILSRPGYPF